MKQALCNVLYQAYHRGWICSKDGNGSLNYGRDDIPGIYITPSGVDKYLIDPEDFIQILPNRTRVFKRHCLEGFETRPSGELAMHLALQQTTEQRCVLHLHPTNILAAMYSGLSLSKLALDFPEVHRYTRVGPTVSNLPAISPELAEETAKCLLDAQGCLQFDIVGQINHGVCAVGRTPWEAFEHVERLEHVCEIVLKSTRR